MMHDADPSPQAADPAADAVGLPAMAGIDAGLLHVLESSSDALAVIDTDGRCLYVNAKASQFLGQDRQSLLGRCWWEAFPADLKHRLQKRCSQALAQQVPLQLASEEPGVGPCLRFDIHPSKTGLTVYWRQAASTNVIYPGEGNQESLLVHQIAWQAIFEKAAIGIERVTCDGRLLEVNPKLCQMLGYSRDELLARTFMDITHPEDLAAELVHLDRLVSGEEHSYTIEKRYIRKDGTPLWVRVTSSLVLKDDWYRVAFVEEVDARKRAEEAWRDSEQRFRLMADAVPYGAWFTDAAGHCTYVSPSFLELVGMSMEHVQRFGWLHLLPPEEVELTKAHWLHCVQTGEASEREQRFRTKDNGWRNVLAVGRPIRDKCGQITSWVGLNLDITDRKRVEEELKAAKLIAEQAQAAAENANKAKDQFLAVLSHELRNPLTPVIAAATMLESDWRLPQEVQDDMRMIRRNIETQVRLIDDLLDLTRITRGKLELRLQPLELGSLLQQAVELCSPDCQAKRQTLALDEGTEPCWVQGDSVRLQQVLWNLLKNAAKFTGEGGHVAVRCSGDGQGRAVIEVIDNGRGIAPDVLPRLFYAFEQGSQLVTQQHGGLGLGLAICKALVEAHRGTISASSPGPGQGATFHIVLPAIAAPPLPIKPDAPLAAAIVSPETERELRILLVDDHIDTARFLGRLLEAIGHRVTVAGTVREAMQVVEQGDFDLLVSDLGLPDGSGLDLMRAIRSAHPSLPGIAVSGYGSDQDIDRSKEAGFLEHLTKPIDFKHLQAVILRLMSDIAALSAAQSSS